MYKVSKPKHCEGCPSNTSADPTNPHVCNWIATSHHPEGRREVIRIVQALMHNNPHPWCGFDREFRFKVVRSAAKAAMGKLNRAKENHHGSKNEPANFGRGIFGYQRRVDISGSERVRRPQDNHLEGAKQRLHPAGAGFTHTGPVAAGNSATLHEPEKGDQ